ncbi:unnamed protein product [Phytophthora fragariaefolia]|uniref:Unnamed protein product n=1 Tax=Phytophthora fragariaefolia TaxID=1490495 RepID=A0A9W7CSZ2_9STRA|nr:unnamed protein product [Phytophthora fragariaefolia]
MSSNVRVYPVVPVSQPRLQVTLGVFERVIRAARRYWNSIQVGHRGRYSVERLLAFQEYYQRTSPGHAFIVCFLALTPPFVIGTLVEFIPLKSPEEGWKANYNFWIRLYASSLAIAFGGVYQVKEVIEPSVLSTVKSVFVAVGTCTCYVGLTMAVAILWKFPIPFGFVMSIGPFIGIYVVLLTLSIGPGVLANSPNLRQQLSSQLLVIAAQGILGIAYPTFAAIFNLLPRYGQTAFIFVLPIIKFSIKQFVAETSTHLHEYVGLTVLLSVDVCNVLYVAICVQTAVSPVTSGLLIAADGFFVLMALRSIYYQSEITQARRRSLSMNSALPPTLNYIRNLRALLREVFQSPTSSVIPRVPIRIRAPFPLPLSVESKTFLNELEQDCRRNSIGTGIRKEMPSNPKKSSSVPRGRNIKTHNNECNSSRIIMSSSKASSHDYLLTPSAKHVGTCSTYVKSTLVHQLSGGTPTPISNSRSKSRAITRMTSREESYHQAVVIESIQDSLQALFHSEYVVMAEFIEFVIPMLYGIYLAVLYHLPAAAYYPHTRTLTAEKFASTEMNIMLYAGVEFASFIGVNMLLQRKFGFSPLYQLAFVCETHVRIIQSHLIIWVIYVLQVSLVHNGKHGQVN